MGKKKKIKIILEKSALGYFAYTNDFSRLQATGNSVQEVKENVLKALEARLLQLEEQGRNTKADIIRNCEVKYLLQV